MSDFFVLGIDKAIYRAGGTADIPNSAESSVKPVLRSDLIYPAGPDGWVVFRRSFLTLSWQDGLDLTFRTFVDGSEVVSARVVAHRSGAGRETLVGDMMIQGRGVRIVVEVSNSTGLWSIEGAPQVAIVPMLRGRGRPA